MSTASFHTWTVSKGRSLLRQVGIRLRQEEAQLPLLSRLLWALAGLILILAAVVLVGDLLGVLSDSPVTKAALQGLGMSVALALLALMTRGMTLTSSARVDSNAGSDDETDERVDAHPRELGESGGLFDTDQAILEAMEIHARVDEDRAQEAVVHELAESDEASLDEARRALQRRVRVTRRNLERLDATLLEEALEDLEDNVPSSGVTGVGFPSNCLLALVGRDRYRARRGAVRWFRDIARTCSFRARSTIAGAVGHLLGAGETPDR